MIKCTAVNPYGEAETEALLSLTKFPPTFKTVLPGSLDIDENETLQLIAAVDGSPIPEIQWFKDGEVIVPDDHVAVDIQPDGNMKLTIKNIKPTDSGSYKVVATNSGGARATSCSVAVMRKLILKLLLGLDELSNIYENTLILAEKKKPCFTKPLESKKLIVGQPLKLEAQIAAVPNPEVQWFKDGQPIRQTEGLNFESEPNGMMGLSIDQVRPENAGTYSIVVTNPLGEATSEANIEVQEKEAEPVCRYETI